jgi:hypothetical protein
MIQYDNITAGLRHPATSEGRRHGRCLCLVAGNENCKLDRVRALVAVAPSGEIKVKKLTVATDVGTQVHPFPGRGLGAVGISLALYEKATLEDDG